MERIDDLQCAGLRLKQDSESYCFTSDAVILANLVKVKRGGVVADFGTGSGVIAILLTAKTQADKIFAIEKQPGLFKLACDNVRLNKLEGKVVPVEGDIEDMPRVLGAGCVDAVVCNPPYFKHGSGETREGESAAARHESGRGLEGIVSAAAAMLRTGGELFLIHRTERLSEVCALAENAGLAVKEMILIRAREGVEPKTFVVVARKGAAQGMKLRTLTVTDSDGKYTDEVAKMYGEER